MALGHRPNAIAARRFVIALLLLATPAFARGAPLGEVGTVVDRARGAVVNVEVVERGNKPPPVLEPWDRGTPEDASLLPGTGTGFVVEPGDLVITNDHLVRGALAVRVHFENGKRIEAQVIGGDETTDVALLRLAARAEGRPLRLAASESLRSGAWLVALGNPSGQTITATVGILSAKARALQQGAYGEFLQTDAAIHPGNTGGPLLDLRSEVIGMSTASIGRGAGINFAVPSSILRTLIPQLVQKGRVSRGWLGAYVSDLTPALAKTLKIPLMKGAVVTQRLAGSPAHRGGIEPDDVLTAIDGEKVTSAAALVRSLAARRPGTSLTLAVTRGGKVRLVRVVLGEQPDWETVGVGPTEPSEPGSRVLKVLGLALVPSPPEEPGVLVAFVRPGSPAAQAGLSEGALLQEVDGKPVESSERVNTLLENAPSGSRVLFRLQLPRLPHPRLRALKIP